MSKSNVPITKQNIHFSACHINPTSLCKHIDFCRFKFANLQYDLIAVTETWFKPLFTDNMAKINGYNLVRNDRIGRRAGEVALFIKHHYNFKTLAFSNNSAHDFFAEYLIGELELNLGNKIFVAVVYRPPNTPFHKGTNFLSVISELSQDYSSKIILGDFNSNMLTVNSESAVMLEFISSNNFLLVNHGVTHVKNNSVTFGSLCSRRERKNYQFLQIKWHILLSSFSYICHIRIICSLCY